MSNLGPFSPLFALETLCIRLAYTTVYGPYLGSFLCISGRIPNVCTPFQPLQPVFLIFWYFRYVYQCIHCVYNSFSGLWGLIFPHSTCILPPKTCSPASYSPHSSFQLIWMTQKGRKSGFDSTRVKGRVQWTRFEPVHA